MPDQLSAAFTGVTVMVPRSLAFWAGLMPVEVGATVSVPIVSALAASSLPNVAHLVSSGVAADCTAFSKDHPVYDGRCVLISAAVPATRGVENDVPGAPNSYAPSGPKPVT